MATSLGALILALLTLLLVEVLLEAWIQELLGDRTVAPGGRAGDVVGDLPAWPKQLKNGLLVALVGLSLAKVAVDRAWRRFTTRADLALVVLAAVMVAAGLLGTSGAVLTGQAVFVYLRGAIVFYAVRALDPARPQIRRMLVPAACVIGASTAVAIVQLFAGRPAYSGVGWVDLTWAGIHRAHGLLDHPNHLGHVLGLALIGLLALMSGPRRGGCAGRNWVDRNRWVLWLAVGAGALGVAAAQSRESLFAVLAAAGLIFVVRRSGGRTLLAASTVMVVVFAGHVVARPGNLEELSRRVRGVFTAVDTPSGEEECAEFATFADCVAAGRVGEREIRVLFFQQGGRLIAHRPVLGYGAGQFGGVVAEQHDPSWELDPRFPGAFNLYGFDGTTVDSFWLHLTVETGIAGLLAYLAWLFLIAAALPRAARHGGVFALWGMGALLFTAIIGAFSPALEDPLYPPLLFAIVGCAWVLASGDPHAERPRAELDRPTIGT